MLPILNWYKFCYSTQFLNMSWCLSGLGLWQIPLARKVMWVRVPVRPKFLFLMKFFKITAEWGICLIKWPEKCLQICHVFRAQNPTNILLFVSTLSRKFIWRKIKQHDINWKTNKSIWVFIFQKYCKYWSILLGHFIY